MVAAVTTAVTRLTEMAHPSGGWSDFWLSPGPSTSWVTAYTVVALAQAADDDRLPAVVRRRAAETAGDGADSLVRTLRNDAWGWNPTVRADADSTAWAVRALGLTGRPVAEGTWDVLLRHRADDGYRTYVDETSTGRWAAAMPDVTAAVLLAQFEGGRIDQWMLGEAWDRYFGGPGPWTSHWWPDAAHPTAIVLAAWHAAGRPARSAVSEALLPTGVSWGSPADQVWVAALLGTSHEGPLLHLLDLQCEDGRWPAAATLAVPGARPDQPAQATVDARSVFTTATSVHALLAVEAWPEAPRRTVGREPSPGPRDRRWDAVVRSVARSQGVDEALARDAFAALTTESLRTPSPWPAGQLSTLAAGLPVELSAAGDHGLRFTCEVGEPVARPDRRLTSGLRALGRTADLVGSTEALGLARPALEVLADPDLPVPEGTRCWLWAGVDLKPTGHPMLKAYVSTQAGEVDGWPERVRRCLLAAGVPEAAPVWPAMARLRGGGWCQELGFGLAPGGRWGLKVYYELAGWRPELVRDLLLMSGLPDRVDAVTPEIPGVLRASLARRQRAGIALRVDPATGRVDELTVAAAFPAPLVGRDVLTGRVTSYLRAVQDPGPFVALVGAVEPSWLRAPASARMLSLFTRSLSRDRQITTIYVRPGPALEG